MIKVNQDLLSALKWLRVKFLEFYSLLSCHSQYETFLKLVLNIELEVLMISTKEMKLCVSVLTAMSNILASA